MILLNIYIGRPFHGLKALLHRAPLKIAQIKTLKMAQIKNLIKNIYNNYNKKNI